MLVIGLGYPLCIKINVFGDCGTSVEFLGLGAFFILVPSQEDIAFSGRGRNCHCLVQLGPDDLVRFIVLILQSHLAQIRFGNPFCIDGNIAIDSSTELVLGLACSIFVPSFENIPRSGRIGGRLLDLVTGVDTYGSNRRTALCVKSYSVSRRLLFSRFFLRTGNRYEKHCNHHQCYEKKTQIFLHFFPST